jgi:hypothetical protein
MENIRPSAGGLVVMTGAWESIHACGMHAELDPEHMTVFEILTGTCLLTFYDDAIRDTSAADESCSENAKDGLCQLVRQTLNSDAPLRMLVAG